MVITKSDRKITNVIREVGEEKSLILLKGSAFKFLPEQMQVKKLNVGVHSQPLDPR